MANYPSHRLLTSVVMLAAVVAVSRPLQAQSRTPLPKFTGQTVTVAGVPDAYDPVRETLGKVQRNSRQRYFVVVVENSGADRFATRDYCFELDRVWREQAKQSGRPYRTDRTILIVLSLSNRQLSVLPSEPIQQEYGLQGESIDRQLVAPHFVPFAKNRDYANGLAVLVREIESWLQAQDTVRQRTTEASRNRAKQVAADAQARRQFITQTLPRLAAAVLSALAAIALAVFWWFSRRHRGEARTALEAYKEQVVQLSDRLDLLQERHRMLPHMDQDYTEPIRGKTLQVYDGVQQAIQKFRDQWLGLMDTWESAETLVEEQGVLGRRKSRQALELLRKINAPGVLETMESECATPLDKLENAHELGQQLIASDEVQRRDLQQRLTAIEADQFGIAAMQQAITTIDAGSAQAQQLLVSDPLGAQQQLEENADRLSQLRQHVDEARDQIERLGVARGDLAAAEDRVAHERGKGMLLQEPDGSPDPMFEQAAQRQTLGHQALERGETEEATTQIDRMVTLIEAAQTLIDEQLAAREFCQQRLDPVADENKALRGRLTDTRRTHAALQREFAASAWSDVDENPGRAEVLVARAAQDWHESVGLCTDEVQHYFRAANLLRSVEEDQRTAVEMIESLAARLAELESLRTSCREQLKRASSRAVQIDQYFAAHTADRPASNQRFRAAYELLDQLRAAADAPQPDWAALSDQLQMAESEIDKSREMAERDVQLQQQAQTELAAADRAIRQARSYYHLGIAADVSPAGGEYEQARGLLASQQYEQAIALAAAAQRSARRAYDDAVRSGRRRQQQINRERQWDETRRPATTQRPGMFPRVPIKLPDFGGRRPTISAPRPSPSRHASQTGWSGPSGGSTSASSGASQSSW